MSAFESGTPTRSRRTAFLLSIVVVGLLAGAWYLWPRFEREPPEIRLSPDADVLDLMSSWVSHLPEPDRLPLGRVVGLGMNAAELAANPRLTSFDVHDLNREPRLPYADASFDAVLCAVSIQYLVRPVEVFAEVARVLRPGGRVAIATSHRCFPTKAIRAFHLLAPPERLAAIARYLELAGGFEAAALVDRSPPGADPLWIVTALRRTATRRPSAG